MREFLTQRTAYIALVLFSMWIVPLTPLAWILFSFRALTPPPEKPAEIAFTLKILLILVAFFFAIFFGLTKEVVEDVRHFFPFYRDEIPYVPVVWHFIVMSFIILFPAMPARISMFYCNQCNFGAVGLKYTKYPVLAGSVFILAAFSKSLLNPMADSSLGLFGANLFPFALTFSLVSSSAVFGIIIFLARKKRSRSREFR